MTEKQLHLPPLQALDPKEGTNLLQILRKRKPTAADTLTLLLSDLAVRTADRRGTYKWDGIEAATQEESWNVTVVPIPYYYRDLIGNLNNMVYEYELWREFNG